MSFTRSLRLNLYGWTLALAICQTALTSYLSGDAVWPPKRGFSYYRGLPEASHNVAYYACAAAVISLFTWIWISVLLAYNNPRKAGHTLAVALYHIISFGVITVLWLVLGTMLLSETRFSCPNVPGSEGIISTWCGLTITTGTIALVLCLLSALTVVAIYSSSRKSPLGLRSPVVTQDGKLDPGPLKGPMPCPTIIRTVLYSLVIVFGIAGTVFGVLHALLSYDEKLQAFAGLAAGLSTISWVWTSVLLSYHRRPSFNRTLTNTSTHFYTLALLATLTLLSGILIWAHTRIDDDGSCVGFSIGADCWPHFADGAVALVLGILLTASATYVFARTRTGGGTLSRSNVAQFDGELPSEPTLLNSGRHEDL